MTIDTHTDTPLRLANANWDIGRHHDSAQPAHGALDFPRMREGGLDTVFFAAYVRQRERNTDNYRHAMETADQIIQAIHRIAAQYQDLASIGTVADDASSNAKKGLLTVYIGMELLTRGYSEKDLQKIWSGNFMRVFREVEKVSREMR